MAVMSRRIVGWGSSSMALIGPAMDSVLAADGVPFVNEGRGGETSHHTAARIGSLPLPVRVAGGTLPGAGTIRLEPTGLDLVATALKPFAGHVGGLEAVAHGDEEGCCSPAPSPGLPSRSTAIPSSRTWARGGAARTACCGWARTT